MKILTCTCCARQVGSRTGYNLVPGIIWKNPTYTFLLYLQGDWKCPCSLFSLSTGFSIRDKATFIPSLLVFLPAITSSSLYLRDTIPCLGQQKSEFHAFLLPFFTSTNEFNGSKKGGATYLTYVITRTYVLVSLFCGL